MNAENFNLVFVESHSWKEEVWIAKILKYTTKKGMLIAKAKYDKDNSGYSPTYCAIVAVEKEVSELQVGQYLKVLKHKP